MIVRMSFFYFVLPTVTDHRIEWKNVHSTMQKRLTDVLQDNVLLNFDKFFLGEEVPFKPQENFIWRDHETEILNVSWQTSELQGECEIWCDSLTSAHVGTLEDFKAGTLCDEKRIKIEECNFHWRIEIYEILKEHPNFKVPLILGSILAQLSDGIIMFDELNNYENVFPQTSEAFIRDEFPNHLYNTFEL